MLSLPQNRAPPHAHLISIQSVLFALLLLDPITLSSARKITVTNSCAGTVWPAYNGIHSEVITVNGKQGAGGWMQAPGQSDVMEVPEDCECFGGEAPLFSCTPELSVLKILQFQMTSISVRYTLYDTPYTLHLPFEQSPNLCLPSFELVRAGERTTWQRSEYLT